MNPVAKVIIGSVVSAVLVDLHAYVNRTEGDGFDWKKAGARWAIGALTGLTAGLGLEAV